MQVFIKKAHNKEKKIQHSVKIFCGALCVLLVGGLTACYNREEMNEQEKVAYEIENTLNEYEFIEETKNKFYDDFIIDNVRINEGENFISLDIDRKIWTEIDIEGYDKMHSVSIFLQYDEKSHLYKNSNNNVLESLDSISIDDSNSFYQPEEYNLLGKANINPYLDKVREYLIYPIIENKKLESINIDGEIICDNSKLIIDSRGLVYDKELKTFTSVWLLGNYYY